MRNRYLFGGGVCFAGTVRFVGTIGLGGGGGGVVG
jgi:hypothetical protein